MVTNNLNNEEQIEYKQFSQSWESIFSNDEFKTYLSDEVLPVFIFSQRWYAGKASNIKYIDIASIQPLNFSDTVCYGLVVEVYFKEAFSHAYFLPITIQPEGKDLPEKAIITSIKIKDDLFFVVDALYLEEYRKAIFQQIQSESEFETENGTLIFEKGSILSTEEEFEQSKLLSGEQSNTSFFINGKYILKIYRRLFDRANPDYEISYFLTETAKFQNSPKYAGSINWKRNENYVISIGLMQEFIPNDSDAWEYFLPHVKSFFEACIQQNKRADDLPHWDLFTTISKDDIPQELNDLFPHQLIDRIDLLGQRTAEMHVKLGSEKQDLWFTPSVYNSDFSVWLKNRLIYQFANRVNLLENTIYKLKDMSLDLAKEFLDARKKIRYHFLSFDETKLKSQRIRIHGDYHLGQVLVTEHDFFIIDFEGEPESTIRDRKVKQAPLKDVAGMIRSFHYAIYSNIFKYKEDWGREFEELFDLGEWLYSYIVGVFMHKYIEVVQDNNLNIGYKSEIEYLLKYNILEKAVYELGYELNSRPTWTIIPLKGISQILKSI